MSTNLPAVIRNLKLFHVSIDFRGEVDNEGLQKTLDKAIRWIQCMPNAWLVLSSSNAERWWARLYPLLGDADTMLILEVVPETMQCWIQQWKIDWMSEATKQIKESRDQS